MFEKLAKLIKRYFTIKIDINSNKHKFTEVIIINPDAKTISYGDNIKEANKQGKINLLHVFSLFLVNKPVDKNGVDVITSVEAMIKKDEKITFELLIHSELYVISISDIWESDYLDFDESYDEIATKLKFSLIRLSKELDKLQHNI